MERLSLLSTEHCPFKACVFLLSFAIFSLHLRSCTLTPSMYMQQQRKQSQQISKRDNKETKEAHKGANKQKQAHKGANKHVIQKKRVSQKDKCRFGFDVQSSIILEYGRHMCHQAKFPKGTRDLVYKDGCEPAGDYKQEQGLMT